MRGQASWFSTEHHYDEIVRDLALVLEVAERATEGNVDREAYDVLWQTIMSVSFSKKHHRALIGRETNGRLFALQEFSEQPRVDLIVKLKRLIETRLPGRLSNAVRVALVRSYRILGLPGDSALIFGRQPLSLERRIIGSLFHLYNKQPEVKSVLAANAAAVRDLTLWCAVTDFGPRSADVDALALATWFGWTRAVSLSLTRFFEAPLQDKLARFIEITGESDKGVACILQVNPASFSRWLRESTNPDTSGDMAKRCEQLLAVFRHTVELTGYNAELASYIWLVRGLHRDAKDRPPWDSKGLGPYLKEGRRTALERCVEWIRKPDKVS